MEVSIEPEQVENRLKKLSDAEIVGASRNFLNLLKNRDPQYAPSSFSKENLLIMANRYLNEYRPLMKEWNRRLAEGFKGVEESTLTAVYRELRGEMPENWREELRDLSKRQVESKDWNPEVDGKRMKFLQEISDFYHQRGEAPFPWLNFLLENKENIKEVVRGIWKNQARQNLSEDERKIMEFLTKINYGKWRA